MPIRWSRASSSEMPIALASEPKQCTIHSMVRLLGLAACVVPSLAWAQTDVVGVVSAAGGYTDNVLSVPDRPENPGDPTPEADSFGEVRPGIYLNVDRKLSAHRLSYTFVSSVYVE